MYESALPKISIVLVFQSDRFLIRQLSGEKIDLNSGQWSTQAGSGGFFPFSTDLPFAQHDWPLGNATSRARVFAEHKWWTQAMLCVRKYAAVYLSTDVLSKDSHTEQMSKQSCLQILSWK